MGNDPRSPADETVWIDICRIVLPKSARYHDPARLNELTEDIRVNGQLQEIVVTPIPSSCGGEGEHHSCYEVLAGVGRVLAARRLEWTKLRACVLKDLTEEEKTRITFSENQKRENASPFYQAALLKRIMDQGGIDQKTLASRVGLDEADVSRYLRLLELPDLFQQSLKQANFSMSHLREFLRLPSIDDQMNIVNACIQEGWSSKQVRDHVTRLLQTPSKRGRKKGSRNKIHQDPLADAWQSLKKDPDIAHPGSWDVDYRGPGQWHFELNGTPADPSQGADPTREKLADWLIRLGQALKQKQLSAKG